MRDDTRGRRRRARVAGASLAAIALVATSACGGAGDAGTATTALATTSAGRGGAGGGGPGAGGAATSADAGGAEATGGAGGGGATGRERVDGGATSSLCLDGYTLCDGRCVVTKTDEDHCGGCGLACPAGVLCFAGHCEPDACGYIPPCGPGTTCCFDASNLGGACVDLETDPNNCGFCGGWCGYGGVCEGGSCAPGCKLGPPCPEGRTCCVPGPGCVDVMSDWANCGGCGVVCGDGPCVDGACKKG